MVCLDLWVHRISLMRRHFRGHGIKAYIVFLFFLNHSQSVNLALNLKLHCSPRRPTAASMSTAFGCARATIERLCVLIHTKFTLPSFSPVHLVSLKVVDQMAMEGRLHLHLAGHPSSQQPHPSLWVMGRFAVQSRAAIWRQ